MGYRRDVCPRAIRYAPTPELMRLFVYSARSPTADLPNTAAFLGGLVAQEIIKMVTRQYVPVKGYCLIDLVGAWTGVMAV
jgi:NEDD8-activating enzyme E1 regulatory subunit